MKRDSLKRIGRPAKACMACATPLDSIERHPSALRDELDAAGAVEDEAGAGETSTDSADAEGAPLREDYCPACWAKLHSEGYFSFWLARRKPRKSLSRFARQRRSATLLELFEASYRESAPTQATKTRQYILAHLLQRAQAVEHLGMRLGSDGLPTLVFACPTLGNREFEVDEQDPTNEEIEAVRTEILARLEQGKS